MRYKDIRIDKFKCLYIYLIHEVKIFIINLNTQCKLH